MNHSSWTQEKLRPIDKKLQYQMEKLLRAAQQLHGGSTDSAAADPLSYGPKPDQLLPKVSLPTTDGGGGGFVEGTGRGDRDGSGLYRPPRNLATAMDDDPDRRRSAKERHAERDGRGRSGRSALVRPTSDHSERLRDYESDLSALTNRPAGIHCDDLTTNFTHLPLDPESGMYSTIRNHSKALKNFTALNLGR